MSSQSLHPVTDEIRGRDPQLKPRLISRNPVEEREEELYEEGRAK